MDRVNEGKSVDSYQHLMIYLETEQRGGSGTLYHQSAIVGVISRRGLSIVELPLISDVDFWVSRNRNL